MFRRYTTEELVASRPSAHEREETRLPVIVVLDNVRSAYNVGLVFRLCDCVNVRELWLSGITAHPGASEHATNHIRKTAVGGSLAVLPWRHMPDPTPHLARLQRSGWQVVAAEQGHGAVDYREARYRFPVALVLGHEREGVADEALDTADLVVDVPVRGITNSLNVAVCGGVLLYDLLTRFEADASGGA